MTEMPQLPEDVLDKLNYGQRVKEAHAVYLIRKRDLRAAEKAVDEAKARAKDAKADFDDAQERWDEVCSGQGQLFEVQG